MVSNLIITKKWEKETTNHDLIIGKIPWDKTMRKKGLKFIVLNFVIIFSTFFMGMYIIGNENSFTTQDLKYCRDLSRGLEVTTSGWIPTEVVSTEDRRASRNPSIAVDDIGNVHVVWTDYPNIFYKLWNSTTSIWAPIELVSTESINGTKYPAIAVDGAGHVHVAWQDRTDYNGCGIDTDIFYKRRNATTGTWTLTEVVSIEGATWSQLVTIAVDGEGNAHLAWDDYAEYSGSGFDKDIFYRQWNSATDTWTQTEVVSTESMKNSLNSAIYIDSSDNVYVAWHDIPDSKNIFYKQRNSITGTWTNTEVVTTKTNYYINYPTLVVDGVGHVHVAWEDKSIYTELGWKIFYKRRNAFTGTWTLTEVVSTESTSDSQDPAMAVDGAGNVHLVWEDKTNYGGAIGYSDIFYKYWNATSNSWTTTEWISTESTKWACNPTIGVDGDGFVHVAWEDNTDYNGAGWDSDIFYKRITEVPNAPILDAILPNPDDVRIIDLSWNDVDSATIYYIYRANSPIISVDGMIPVAATTMNYHQDHIPFKDTYYYVIVAGNPLGNSSFSNSESIVVMFQTPNAPILEPILPNPDNDQIIELNWNDVVGATIYYVYRSNSLITSVDGMTPIASIFTNNYQDTLTINGKYYYVITAGNAFGNSFIFNCEHVFVVKPPPLFDGMYITYNFYICTNNHQYYLGSSKFAYSQVSESKFNVSWHSFRDDEWEEDIRTRNIIGSSLFGRDVHTPVWLFTNISLGDSVQIAILNVSSEGGDHTFNVSSELIYDFPGLGPLGVWVLEDLKASGAVVWYEKSMGILLNGTFYDNDDPYTFDLKQTNFEFIYATNNYAPELSSGSVSPLTGNQNKQFTFSAIYRDQDNFHPVFINVLINGTSYPMEKQDPNDLNFKDGCIYQYSTFLQPGSYNYSFECHDGMFYNSSATYTGLKVIAANFFPPILSGVQVNTETGYNVTSTFIILGFTINYTDADNNAPEYMNITLNSTKYSMIKQDPLDVNYMDGCLYVISNAMDGIGAYTYHFNCSDGVIAANLGPYIGSFKKIPFFDGMYINYTKIYNAHSDSQMNCIYSQVSGSIFHMTDMLYQDSWDIDVQNRIITNNSGYMDFNDGAHTPLWIFTNVSLGDLVRIGVGVDHTFRVSGELVYNIPGFGPVEVWVLEDESYYDGALWYEKSTGLLLNGTIIEGYVFGTELSNTFNLVDTNVEFNYLDCSSPELTFDSVVPEKGNQNTQFNFSVIYTDPNNDPPTHIYLLINETPYPLQKQNPLDINYSDGNIYQYITYLTPGNYFYSFVCSDGIFFNSTKSSILMVNYTNLLVPNLIAGSVTPSNGTQSTIFNFSVIYVDYENNPPEYVNILINGKLYSMEKQNPSDDYYTDGCGYQYLTFLALGNYEYSFECSNEKFHHSTTPFTNLTVKKINNNIPILVDGQVTPEIGYINELSVFTVEYIDADNNPPEYVNVIINSTSYPMIQQDPLDNNYMDGCNFTFSTILEFGNYSFIFQCSDGDNLISYGPHLGPAVEFAVQWDEVRLDGIRIGSVIAHGELNPRTRYPTICSELIQRGTIITDITSTINLVLLSNFDILWFDGLGSSLTENEINAIEQWVYTGGSFIITDEAGGSASSLIQRFNISYVEIGYRSWPSRTIYPHPITFDMNELRFSGEWGLNLSSQPNAILCAKSSNDDIIMAMNYGEGRFVVISGENTLIYIHHTFHPYDNGLLINNTFGWLGYTPTISNPPVLLPISPNPDGDGRVWLLITIGSVAVIVPSSIIINRKRQLGVQKRNGRQPLRQETIPETPPYIEKFIQTPYNKQKQEIRRIFAGLSADKKEIRRQAAKLLEKLIDERVVFAFVGVLITNKEGNIRAMACIALGMIGTRLGLPVLKRIMEIDDDPIVLKYAAEAAAWIESLNHSPNFDCVE